MAEGPGALLPLPPSGPATRALFWLQRKLRGALGRPRQGGVREKEGGLAPAPAEWGKAVPCPCLTGEGLSPVPSERRQAVSGPCPPAEAVGAPMRGAVWRVLTSRLSGCLPSARASERGQQMFFFFPLRRIKIFQPSQSHCPPPTVRTGLRVFGESQHQKKANLCFCFSVQK